MTSPEMTPMQRVLTSLSHKEPDRVPLFLLLTMHGAKELGMSIKDYFSKAEHLAQAQLLMQKKYANDCLVSLFYAPMEVEAFGADVIFVEDGPPNSGEPFVKSFEEIKKLKAPNVKDSPLLQRVLKATELLKASVQDTVPIIGVVVSPFSLPVMQLGFDKYLELMYFEPKLFEQLMQINEAFCIEWANAQLEAGATAICYFDPVSSPTIIPRHKYLETGFQIAKRTIAQIKGPTATHFASGITLPIFDDVAQTGTAIIGVSSMEDLSALKAVSRGKLTLLGNLNGIEMRRWNQAETEEHVRACIRTAAPGGGFLLADNHGEIPYQVSEEVLLTISETVRTYGTYPIGNNV